MIEALYRLVEAVLPADGHLQNLEKRLLLAVFLLAPVVGGLGSQVLLLRRSYFSEAVGHSAFAGVAAGALLGLMRGPQDNPALSLVVVGVIVGLMVVFVRERSRMDVDTVVGVVLAAVTAGGIVLGTLSGRAAGLAIFTRALFGDLLLVSEGDLLLLLVLAGAVTAYLAFFGNSLALMALQPELARTRGVAVRWHEYIFSAGLAAGVAVLVPVVGLLMVTALLVVPAATARNLSRSTGGFFWASIGCALLSGLGGLWAAYQIGRAPVGAVIVLAASALFFLSLIARPLLTGSAREQAGREH